MNSFLAYDPCKDPLRLYYKLYLKTLKPRKSLVEDLSVFFLLIHPLKILKISIP